MPRLDTTKTWTQPAAPKPGDRRYSLRSTQASSAKFGPCEVCGHHCSEVFIQATEQRVAGLDAEPDFWRHVSTDFGHDTCLIERRAEKEPAK